MNYEHLSNITNIPSNEVQQVWEDFVGEVKKAWVTKSPFIYNDLLVEALPLKSFTSQYVLDLINGKTTAEEFTKEMPDKRKKDFAKIIYFILREASYEPFNAEELGTFYLFGKLGRTARNPQTNELIKIPVSINLGFKPNF